jgi:hypothetical protein
MAIVIAVQLSVVHETFPKLPAPPPYPGPGQVLNKMLRNFVFTLTIFSAGRPYFPRS